MKKINLGLVLFLSAPFALFTHTSFAQNAPSGKTLAATLDVFVFPAQGQNSSQQSKQEAECYNWAVNNTGNDPFSLQKDSAAQQQQTAAAKSDAAQPEKGAGARGALRGAAVGALIGEIADDNASDGAGYGAAAGLMRGRRNARRASQQAVQQVEKQGATLEQSTQHQMTNFKKSFSVCLEAKQYMVKY